MITHGSLFSGIGLLDLGLEQAGMTTIWHAEVDPNASKVLAMRWPAIPNLGDVTKVDWSVVEPPDVLSFGFPCPPFSTAGKKLGRDDERYLWPTCMDAVRVLRPRLVIVENVAALLSADAGAIFNDILSDLAEAGFDAKWRVLRASDVGAPHRRERIFVAAYPQCDGVDADRRVHEGVRGGGDSARREAVPAGAQMAQSANALPSGADVAAHPSGARPQGRDGSDLGGPADPSAGGRGSIGPALSRGLGWHPHSAGEGPQGPAERHEGRQGPEQRGTAAADPGRLRPQGSSLTGGSEGLGASGDEPARGDAASIGGHLPRGTASADPSGLGRGPGTGLRTDGAGGVGRGRPDDQRGETDWGPYAPAIARWERILGRPAPRPLDDNGRLNVELTAWMMAAPPGWCENGFGGGISRSAALKGYGNAVVVTVAKVIGEWALEGMP